MTTDAQGNIYAVGQSNGVKVLWNAGQTINPRRVATASSVGIVGATPDGGILYAGTSQGILLSVDSGATRQQTGPLPIPGAMNPSRSVSVTAFAIDSLDPATTLVATNSGLYGTDSAGQFWGERNTGLNVSASGFVSVASVFYNPVNPLIAYTVTSGPSYLFASSDAGNTVYTAQ